MGLGWWFLGRGGWEVVMGRNMTIQRAFSIEVVQCRRTPYFGYCYSLVFSFLGFGYLSRFDTEGKSLTTG